MNALLHSISAAAFVGLATATPRLLERVGDARRERGVGAHDGELDAPLARGVGDGGARRCP